MDFKLKIWRQKNAQSKGEFKNYTVTGIEEDASFLEMLDILNEQLVRNGDDPVAVDTGCQSYGPVSFDQTKYYTLVSVIDGDATLTADGQAYSISKGDHFILPNQIKNWTIDGNVHIIASNP